MKTTSNRRKGSQLTHETATTVPARIGFPQKVYPTPEEIRTKKKVSVAWLVKEAVQQSVADEWPLLKHSLS